MRPAGLPPAQAAGPRSTTRALVLWDADNCRPPRSIPPPALVSAVTAAVGAAASRDLDVRLAAPPPIALFANAAVGDLSRWKDAGVSTIHSVPCTPGAADQAITAAAGDFVRASSGDSPSLLALVSADDDFAGLLRWAGAQPGVSTLVIGGFPSRPTSGPDGWRRRSKLAGAAGAALHWAEVVEAARQ